MRREIDPALRETLNTIGETIRQIRKERTNLNYKEFAKQLQKDGVEISKNTLLRIESGSENYNVESLLSLLVYFDLKLSEFFKEAGL